MKVGLEKLAATGWAFEDSERRNSTSCNAAIKKRA